MSDDSTEPPEAIERQTYLEHRKSLVELGVAQIGLFDKTLLLLSTGALGSSALFVNTFVGPTGKLNIQTVLAISWLAFVITMVANLLSYLSSWYDMETERKAWDNKYENNDLTIPHDNRWRLFTQSLNVIALLSFVFGLACMLVFCFNNLGEGREPPFVTTKAVYSRWSAFTFRAETCSGRTTTPGEEVTKASKPPSGREQTIALQVDITPVNVPGGSYQTHGAISASPPLPKPKPKPPTGR